MEGFRVVLLLSILLGVRHISVAVVPVHTISGYLLSGDVYMNE